MKIGSRKQHKGRVLDGTWYFGGISRRDGRAFIAAVPDRTSATLLPIVEKCVARGSTVISDCWRAYRTLSVNPRYQYLTVNHSQNFVDPITGRVHSIVIFSAIVCKENLSNRAAGEWVDEQNRV